MTDAPAIEVRDLHKAYRNGLVFRRSFNALNGVSLQVNQGEIFGLLGPNGAGKTTVVKLLLGIIRKTRGEAAILGLPAGVRAVRKRIGYLPENLRIPRHHNALSALDLFGRLSGLSGRTIKDRRMALLESVDLADRAKDSVKKYSKGMVQRLGLAIALLHEPELIFMDEPTDGLDPVGRAEVRRVLLRLKGEGKTVFLNSHLLQEVEMICDRVAILDRGTLRGIGTVDQLVPHRADGVELEMELHGSEDGMRRAAWAATPKIQAIGPDQFRVNIRLTDQDEVDRCVDSVRQQELSIVSMIRHRVSLEDAFLEVLGQTKEKP